MSAPTGIPLAAEAHARPPHRPWLRPALITAIVIAAVASLTVDIYPIITNDSLAYIGHSNRLIDTGLVQLGYRQFGYPGFLAIVDATVGRLGADPLLFTVVIQRALLVGALAYGIVLLRWFALPIAVLSLAPPSIAYTNFLLTEGLGIGLAVLFGLLVVHAGMLLKGTHTPSRLMTATALNWIIAGATAVFIALAFIRFHYAVLGLALSVVTGAAIVAADARKRITLWVIAGVAIAILAAGYGRMAVENYREYGVLSPTTRVARAQFWIIHNIVFGTTDPELTVMFPAFYGDGDPYDFMYEIDSMPTYEEQAAAYDKAVTSLLAASRYSLWEQRGLALLGTLRGGRIDDVAGTVAATIPDADPARIEQLIHRNAYSRIEGASAFAERFNDGIPVRAVLVSALLPKPPLTSTRTLLSLLIPLSLAVLVVGAFVPGARIVAIAGLFPMLVFIAGVSWFLIDVNRYMLVPLYALIAIATGTGAFVGSHVLAARKSTTEGRTVPG